MPYFKVKILQETAKHRKTPISLYIFLKKIKNFFATKKSKKQYMLFFTSLYLFFNVLLCIFDF